MMNGIGHAIQANLPIKRFIKLCYKNTIWMGK